MCMQASEALQTNVTRELFMTVNLTTEQHSSAAVFDGTHVGVRTRCLRIPSTPASVDINETFLLEVPERIAGAY